MYTYNAQIILVTSPVERRVGSCPLVPGPVIVVAHEVQEIQVLGELHHVVADVNCLFASAQGGSQDVVVLLELRL